MNFKQRAYQGAMRKKQEEKKQIQSMFVESGQCDDLINTHKLLHEEKKKIKIEDLPF